MKIIIYIFLLFPLLLYGNIYIRINQVGYLPQDIKQAIVGSELDIEGAYYSIKNTENDSVVAWGYLAKSIKSSGPDTPFTFNYIIDFSYLKNKGIYKIEIKDSISSYPFMIGFNTYNNIIDNLLYFLRVERCGDTQPELHGACHLYDATNVPFDFTGGWHDAGDFLKFTQKEAYTTYLLLLAYEQSRLVNLSFYSDNNSNGMPDILDEAKIGLDYLAKLFPDSDHFVIQIGDLKADHSQGYRLPENDKLAKTNRPAYFSFERDPLSKTAFALALGAKIFMNFPGYKENAQKYLTVAKKAFNKAEVSGSGHEDKLCLASFELYLATGEQQYWNKAIKYSNQISWSDWGHYSNNTNLANARLAPYLGSAREKLQTAVEYFNKSSNSNLFGYDVPYSWGSLYIALSSANAALFYTLISNDISYIQLPIKIRDYTLGKNPWGISFISGVGTDYPRNVHNGTIRALKEMGVLSENTVPGAIAEGPFSRSLWEQKYASFVPPNEDRLIKFHTSASVYHDHLNDYVTNEPTIYGAAEAILHFSLFQIYALKYKDQIPARPRKLKIVD